MARARVKYKGLSDVREITPKDLKGSGVSIDKTLRWDRRNGFSQDVEMTDRLLEILKGEEHFTVSTLNDSAETSEHLVTASPEAGEEADVLVDGRTGDSTETGRSA